MNTTVNGNQLVRYPINVWSDSPVIPDEANDFSDGQNIVVHYTGPYTGSSGHALNANLGNVWCGLYEALLVMYEKTGDKGYLYKFM